MLRMQNHQDGLVRRLSVIGVPMYTVRPFVDLMVRWEICSGVEWTISRLKGLKVDLIRRRSGLEPLTWVRKNRSGDVAGVIGSLFRWSDIDDRNFERCVQAFMAYSYYILPSLSETQKAKFLQGINPETKEDLSDSLLKGFGDSVSQTVRQRRVTCSGNPLVIYQGSPGKKAPSLFGRRSKPQGEKILDDLQFFNTPGGLNLYGKFRRLYEPLLVGLDGRRSHLNWSAENAAEHEARFGPQTSGDPVMGGEIHFLQEPGGKLRSIASPLRLHQEALRPLGRLLFDVVKSLPWDCTFDQSKAIPHIQSCLRQGCQVHSIDLSSATDHFPLSLQVEALRAFIHKDDWDHIDLFIEISRGIWKSPIGWLSWTKGQPLGLYPSFAAFTLTHGLLLNYLDGGDFRNRFFVVGDDVVILDNDLRDRYVSMLDRMSCPYSTDKSISSRVLSEFAGKIITSDRVIPQLKWRKLSDDNFLDICRLLGRKSYSLLSSRQKRVYEMVAHICDPIGLNFSLPGDNLAKMIERTLDFYQPEKEVLGSLMGLRRRMNHVVQSSGSETFDADALEGLAITFDEKVKSVLSQTVFNRWESSISIGLDAFATLPQALDLKPRLPLREFASSRQTTLERYERYLNRKHR